ncbi:MAG: FAD:protein FMN transferase [Phycisphaerales bacterium]|nr:FAD:protein FMN transferase [Phycisphaerales bacterium]
MVNREREQSSGWSRRGLFSARGLGSSTGGLLELLIPDVKPAADEQRIGYWCFSRRAMACPFNIYLPPFVLNPMLVAEIALNEIEDMETLLSAFRADSALSYMNAHAASQPVRVDGRLYRLIRRASELFVLTDGAFDVSSGALVRMWGFLHGPPRVPSETEQAYFLARCGMGNVQLDDIHQTVYYRNRGLEINLGSIGKGYAIDRAVLRIREQFGVSCALLQGGGSSVYGMGCPLGRDRGWLVGVRDPYEPDKRAATLRVWNRALGTSAATYRYGEYEGQRYGHILDPRTGLPADELGSVSVLADDAATADALATGLFVMGLDKAADFCHNHPEIAALLVLKPKPGNSKGQLPPVVTFNLPRTDIMIGRGRSLSAA